VKVWFNSHMHLLVVGTALLQLAELCRHINTQVVDNVSGPVLCAHRHSCLNHHLTMIMVLQR